MDYTVDSVAAALGNTRVQGGLKVLGGSAEAAGGFTFGVASSWTGQQNDPLVSAGLQQAGVSPAYATVMT